MTIAIMGAGIMGCCLALAAAERGSRVVMFERRERPMMEASRWSEGKLHLGFVYAGDSSLNTARRMIDGALSFFPVLSRWIDTSRLEQSMSSPFHYANHVDSLRDDRAIQHHFEQISSLIPANCPAKGLRYPGLDDRPLWEKQSVAANGLNERFLSSAYLTAERSVDTWLLADQLAEAVEEHPRIDCRTGCTVHDVSAEKDSYLSFDTESARAQRDGPFDLIVNATWINRPVIDARQGLKPIGPWLNRFKLGVNFTTLPSNTDHLSVTYVLGPFGDAVQFPSGRSYLSWYPAGMIGTSNRAEYHDWQRMLSTISLSTIAQQTLDSIRHLMSGLEQIDLKSTHRSRVEGGGIYALGDTDIDDPKSRLHHRLENEVLQRGNYVSIDTAKLTLAPSAALTLAEQLLPKPVSIAL